MSRKIATAAIGSIAIAIALAPLAQADDSTFVQNLANNGIHLGGSPVLLGNEGRQICDFVNKYAWTAAAVRYVPISKHPSLTAAQADTFVTVAMQTFCP